jgi:hypothetical protein
MDLHSSDKKISEDDLTDFDQEHYKWCQSVIAEYEQIDMTKLTDFTILKKQAPTIYKQLEVDAETDQESLGNFLKQYDKQLDYFVDLIRYCQDEIKKAKQRPLVLDIARTVQNKRAILQGPLRDVLAKYQVMLDNELYKSIKALRETQVWRLDSLNGFVLENTAGK